MNLTVFYIIIFNFLLIYYFKNKASFKFVVLSQIFNIIFIADLILSVSLRVNYINLIQHASIVIYILFQGFFLNQQNLRIFILFNFLFFIFFKFLNIINIYKLDTNIIENTILICLITYLIKEYKNCKILFKITILIFTLIFMNSTIIKANDIEENTYLNLINDLNLNEISIDTKYKLNNSNLIFISNKEFNLYICIENIEFNNFICNERFIILKDNKAQINELGFVKIDNNFYIPKFNLFLDYSYKNLIKELKTFRNQEIISKKIFEESDFYIINITLYFIILLESNQISKIYYIIRKKYFTNKKLIIIFTSLIILVFTFNYTFKKYNSISTNNETFIREFLASSKNYEIVNNKNITELKSFPTNNDYIVSQNNETIGMLLSNTEYLNKLITTNPSNIIYKPLSKNNVSKIIITIKNKCSNIIGLVKDKKGFEFTSISFYESLNTNEFQEINKYKILNDYPCFIETNDITLEIDNFKSITKNPAIIKFSNNEIYEILNLELYDDKNNKIEFSFLQFSSNRINVKGIKLDYFNEEIKKDISFSKSENHVLKFLKVIFTSQILNRFQN